MDMYVNPSVLYNMGISFNHQQSTCWWLFGISSLVYFFPPDMCFQLILEFVSLMYDFSTDIYNVTVIFSPVSWAFSLLSVFITEILDYSYLAGGWGDEQIAALLAVTVIETYQFLAITFLCPMSSYNWVHYMLSWQWADTVL